MKNNIKQKTITSFNEEEHDALCNEFRKMHNCIATQTHVISSNDESIYHVTVIFYDEEWKKLMFAQSVTRKEED